MKTNPSRTITVGVDGSPESVVAARWAAREAQRRHQDLLLLHAHHDSAFTHHSADASSEDEVGKGQASQDLLSVVGRMVAAANPDLTVRLSSVTGDPRPALRAASATSALTVVGTRGRGRIAEALLGSVALSTASRAQSPVAVVPPTTDISETAAVGPVLLGADGTGASEAAIGYAYDEAAVRCTELLAATVWDDPALRGFAITAPLVGVLEDQEEELVLAEQLAGWSGKYPDVHVSRVVLRGRPATQLLSYRPAGGPPPPLIVVGSRGRGGLTGLALGSTTHQLISATHVPVIIVRPSSEH